MATAETFGHALAGMTPQQLQVASDLLSAFGFAGILPTAACQMKRAIGLLILALALSGCDVPAVVAIPIFTTG